MNNLASTEDKSEKLIEQNDENHYHGGNDKHNDSQTKLSQKKTQSDQLNETFSSEPEKEIEDPDHQVNLRMQRKNGLQCPWSIAQIIAMAVFFMNLAVAIFIDLPALYGLLSSGGIVLFIVLIVLDFFVFVYAFICSIKDPTDPTIYRERACKSRGLFFDDEAYSYYCDKCQGHVEEKTKHCQRCNRCTKDFDHHCIWMNNCVGYNNYQQFFILIVVFLSESILQTALQGYISANAIEQSTSIIAAYSKFFGISNPLDMRYLKVLSTVSLVVCLLISISLTYLVTYHIWLKLNNMSTYAHIMLRRKRQLEKTSAYHKSTADHNESIRNEELDLEIQEKFNSNARAKSESYSSKDKQNMKGRSQIQESSNNLTNTQDNDQSNHEYTIRFDQAQYKSKNNQQLQQHSSSSFRMDNNVGSNNQMIPQLLSMQDQNDIVIPSSDQYQNPYLKSSLVQKSQTNIMVSSLYDKKSKSPLLQRGNILMRTSSDILCQQNEGKNFQGALSVKVDYKNNDSFHRDHEKRNQTNLSEYQHQLSRTNSIANNSILSKVRSALKTFNDPQVHSPRKKRYDKWNNQKRVQTNQTPPLWTEQSNIDIGTTDSQNLFKYKYSLKKSFQYQNIAAAQLSMTAPSIIKEED